MDGSTPCDVQTTAGKAEGDPRRLMATECDRESDRLMLWLEMQSSLLVVTVRSATGTNARRTSSGIPLVPLWVRPWI